MDEIITTWQGNMKFSSSNPSGYELFMDTSSENGGNNEGFRPKSLMLNALSGCAGLDVAFVIKKMRLELSDFKIKVTGFLTKEQPQTYNKVLMEYYFEGEHLNEEKLKRTVDLSSEKYCGVMHMFRHFAEIEIKLFFNGKESIQ